MAYETLLTDLRDGIFTLTYLFLGGSPPAPPTGELGLDPTCDVLASCR